MLKGLARFLADVKEKIRATLTEVGTTEVKNKDIEKITIQLTKQYTQKC